MIKTILKPLIQTFKLYSENKKYSKCNFRSKNININDIKKIAPRADIKYYPSKKITIFKNVNHRHIKRNIIIN